jgi:predicted hydrocarbon binding protein
MPKKKMRDWMAKLHQTIGSLDEEFQRSLVKPCGERCANDLLQIIEKHTEKKIESVKDLVSGWNSLRKSRKLNGGWQYGDLLIKATFYECGCPLVHSGLLKLHPVQCYCSESMLKEIFSRVAKKPVTVEINRSIGRGDNVCEFIIKDFS